MLRKHPNISYLGLSHNLIGAKPAPIEALGRLLKKNHTLSHLMLGYLPPPFLLFFY